jgi:hypothetical protein
MGTLANSAISMAALWVLFNTTPVNAEILSAHLDSRRLARPDGSGGADSGQGVDVARRV